MHQTGAEMATAIMMQGPALAQRHADHAALGLLGGLPDRLGHLARGFRINLTALSLLSLLTGKDILLPEPGDHITDWLDCIVSRKRCICDVEVGARSIACAHLCNIAYWLKRPLNWNPDTWQFENDAEANAWADYQRRAGYELPSV